MLNCLQAYFMAVFICEETHHSIDRSTNRAGGGTTYPYLEQPTAVMWSEKVQ